MRAYKLVSVPASVGLGYCLAINCPSTLKFLSVIFALFEAVSYFANLFVCPHGNEGNEDRS